MSRYFKPKRTVLDGLELLLNLSRGLEMMLVGLLSMGVGAVGIFLSCGFIVVTLLLVAFVIMVMLM